MSLTLCLHPFGKNLKAIVDARLARSRKRRLPQGFDSVDLGQGFHLHKDGAKLLIVQDGDPQAAGPSGEPAGERCGSISPDGEWHIWPVWYEVIAEVLGIPEQVDSMPAEVDAA